MIKFFFNENNKVLSIFSETGEYFIIEKDSLYFKDIFNACKNPKKTFNDVKIFFDRNAAFNIEENDVKVFSDKNGCVCIKNTDSGNEFLLPDYLKNIIFYAKVKNIPTKNFIQFLSIYTKFDFITKSEYDNILSRAMFSICEDGSLMVFCMSNGNLLFEDEYKDIDVNPFFINICFSNLFINSHIDLKSLEKYNVEDMFTTFFRSKCLEEIKFIGEKGLFLIKQNILPTAINDIYNLYVKYWNNEKFDFFENEKKFFSNDMFALIQDISYVLNFTQEEVERCFDLYSPKNTIVKLLRL